jgi:alpha-ketoglutarate-dependent taurine dioxygenase
MTPNPIQAFDIFPGASSAGPSPFELTDDRAYRQWREAKLSMATGLESADRLMVPVSDPSRLTEAEQAALVERMRRCNMAFYRCGSQAATMDREAVRRLGAALGLHRLDNHLCAEEDGVSELQVSEGGRAAEYIPYTDRPLSWHCDGYYHPPERRIRAMLLHCVSEAEAGGENAFLDHERLYLLLRDENPEWIAALSHPEAFTIPPNVENGVTLRGAQSGPVFSVDPLTGRLHMRYTARQRNIQWRDDAATLAAAARIREILAGDGPGILRYRLRPGEGIICNNVLHARTGFRDNAGAGRRRLIYRARYLDRVAGT